MNDESFYNRGIGLSSRKTVNGDFKRLCKVILDGKAETIDMGFMNMTALLLINSL